VLFDGSRRVGLGLEYSGGGTIHYPRALAAELGVLAAGMAVDRAGRRRPGEAGRRAPGESPPRSSGR